MDCQYHVGCFKLAAHTCSQCRWRKVRCDKRRSTCSNCERLGLSCSFSMPDAMLDVPVEDDTSLPMHLGKPRRLRGSRACVACRNKKIKCSATLPSCSSCRQHARACVYPTPKQRFRSHDGGHLNEPQVFNADQQGPFNPSTELDLDPASAMSSPSPPSHLPSPQHLPPSPLSCQTSNRLRRAPVQPGSPGTAQEFPHEILSRLVDVFFDSIYPMPSYSFLHPQTTKRRCHNGGTHDDLISAVCAITALYLDGTDGVTVSEDTASFWIQAAEQSVWQHLECPSIPRLQTLLLVIHYRMETGRFQRAFMLMATAARYAAAMHLNHERPGLDPVAREVRRRTLWSLKILERYFSSGLAEFDLFPLETIYIDFPHSEEAFTLGSQRGEKQGQQQAGDSDPKSRERGDEESGAYRLIVRLESVRTGIMKMARSIALIDKELPSLSDLIRHHDQALATLELPTSLSGGDITTENRAITVTDRNSNPNLRPNQDRWLSRRVLAHVSWHQAHCDIYRILLPGYPDAAPAPALKGIHESALAAAEEKCLHHATRILKIITTLNENSTRHHLLEFDIAICTYHAAQLVLFISHSGKSVDRPTPEYAASRADLCLTALKRFFPSSALVAPIIQELGRSLNLFSEQQQNRRHGPRPRYIRLPGDQRRPSLYESPASPRQLPSSAGEYQQRQRQDGDGQARKKQLSDAAQTRQRLAIHSLLRRADFSGDEEAEEKTTRDPTPSPRGGLQHQPQIQRQDDLAATSSMSPRGVHISTDIAMPLTPNDQPYFRETLGALNTDNLHGTNGSAEASDVAHPNYDLGSMNELDFTNSPSTVSFQEIGLTLGLGPQDWDWLLIRRESPLES